MQIFWYFLNFYPINLSKGEWMDAKVFKDIYMKLYPEKLEAYHPKMPLRNLKLTVQALFDPLTLISKPIF